MTNPKLDNQVPPDSSDLSASLAASEQAREELAPVKLLKSRTEWYRHGCPGMEELSIYQTDPVEGLMHDAAHDLAAALQHLAEAEAERDALRANDDAIRSAHGWKRDGRELPVLVEELAVERDALRKDRDELRDRLSHANARLMRVEGEAVSRWKRIEELESQLASIESLTRPESKEKDFARGGTTGDQ